MRQQGNFGLSPVLGSRRSGLRLLVKNQSQKQDSGSKLGFRFMVRAQACVSIGSFRQVLGSSTVFRALLLSYGGVGWPGWRVNT